MQAGCRAGSCSIGKVQCRQDVMKAQAGCHADIASAMQARREQAECNAGREQAHRVNSSTGKVQAGLTAGREQAGCGAAWEQYRQRADRINSKKG